MTHTRKFRRLSLISRIACFTAHYLRKGMLNPDARSKV